MSKAKVIADKIHLKGVRIIKSHFEVSETYKNEDITSFSMGFKSLTDFNLKENNLIFKLFVKIKGLNEQNEFLGICGEYQMDFHFVIENMNDLVHWEKGADKDKDDFIAVQALGATIAGISYSTSRGIILDRTQATCFTGVLIPVINPNELLLKDTFTDL